MATIAKQTREQYGALTTKMSLALSADDDASLSEVLDEIVHLREKNLFVELRKLTDGLQGALERFQFDSRLTDLAEKEMPDARSRLEHVLKLTDAAAHRTLDFIEQSVPIAGRTSREAAQLTEVWKRFRARVPVLDEFRDMLEKMDKFLPTVHMDTETLRRHLAEVLMVQSYQDLTGQIIRGVMQLVAELEVTLGELVCLSAVHGKQAATASNATATKERPRGHGPAVPGVDHGDIVDGQTDVDSLLSGLGL